MIKFRYKRKETDVSKEKPPKSSKKSKNTKTNETISYEYQQCINVVVVSWYTPASKQKI